jgi:hypothetical protein
VHTSCMRRRWLVAVVVVALIVIGTTAVVVRRGHDQGETSRGALTPRQYAVALEWARTEVARTDAQLSRAVAAIGPAPKSDCSSKHVVHVYLVGKFPYRDYTGPRLIGPDTWMYIAVDAATYGECAEALRNGRFHPPPGSTDLLPGL